MNSLFRTVAGFAATLAVFVAIALSPALAVEIPSDDEQDVLIRTTLMTFNDANMTNNYAVLIAKASKQFQSQLTPEKLSSAFEGFRTNKLFFEDIVAEEYDSSEKAQIDSEGALVLAGAFKSEVNHVKYKLRFVQNDNVWKLLGINVDVRKL